MIAQILGARPRDRTGVRATVLEREQVAEVSELVEVSVVGSRVLDVYNSGEDEKEGLRKVSAFIRSLRRRELAD